MEALELHEKSKPEDLEPAGEVAEISTVSAGEESNGETAAADQCIDEQTNGTKVEKRETTGTSNELSIEDLTPVEGKTKQFMTYLEKQLLLEREKARKLEEGKEEERQRSRIGGVPRPMGISHREEWLKQMKDSGPVVDSNPGVKTMWVRALNGEFVKIDYDRERPTSFKSNYARWWWDEATRINMGKVRSALETGEITPEEYREKSNMTREERIKKRQEEIDRKERKLQRLNLKIQELNRLKDLIQIDSAIKSSLMINNLQVEAATRQLRNLLTLNLIPLTIKKYPHILTTLVKCRMLLSCPDVSGLAVECYSKIEGLFDVDDDIRFDEFIIDAVAEFDEATSGMEVEDIAQLTKDPEDMGSDEEYSDSSEDDDDDLIEEEEDEISQEYGVVPARGVPVNEEDCIEE